MEAVVLAQRGPRRRRIIDMDLIEKIKRPGLLGLAGRVKENACKRELRTFFAELGQKIVGLGLQYVADTPKNDQMVRHAVELKVRNLLRSKSDMFEAIMKHHLEQAILLASKMDYMQEAEFQEWPDASGEDDHGRDGGASVRDQSGSEVKLAGTYYFGADQQHQTLKPDPVVYMTPDKDVAQFHATKRGGSGHVHEVPVHALVGHRTDLKVHVMTPEKIDDLFSHSKTVAALKNKGFSGAVSTDGRTLAWFSSIKPKESFSEATNKIDKLGQTGKSAAEWAKEQAAKLVKGVNETIIDLLAGAVSKGIETLAGPDGTGRLIRDVVDDMSTRRADMIATTEMNRAMSTAALDKLGQMGIEYKQIILAEGACDICESCADEDPKPVDESYNTGDDGPPFHPNCRCAVTGARPPEED